MITPRELEFIDFLIRFRDKHKLPPTYEEMAFNMGVSRAACYQMANRLKKKEWLRKGKSKTRNITVNMKKYAKYFNNHLNKIDLSA